MASNDNAETTAKKPADAGMDRTNSGVLVKVVFNRTTVAKGVKYAAGVPVALDSNTAKRYEAKKLCTIQK